jgi:hypothetical protein
MNKLITALLAVALALLLTTSAWAEWGAEQAKPADTTADKPADKTGIPEAGLTGPEAEMALKKVLPDVKVLSVEPAAIGGLWEIAFISRGDKGILYMDSTKTHIMVGSLIRITDGTNFTKRKFESISTVDFASIPLENSLVVGKRDAQYKVVVFDDPD